MNPVQVVAALYGGPCDGEVRFIDGPAQAIQRMADPSSEHVHWYAMRTQGAVCPECGKKHTPVTVEVFRGGKLAAVTFVYDYDPVLSQKATENLRMSRNGGGSQC